MLSKNLYLHKHFRIIVVVNRIIMLKDGFVWIIQNCKYRTVSGRREIILDYLVGPI